MATFLTREEIVRTTDKIIEEADRELILISPFIKPDDETKNLLENKRRVTAIHVIYGKKELNSKERAFLDSLGIKPTFRKNLHAKCYLNENEALLTSMNLYQFSQEHNDEMGILVSSEDDAQLYKDIYRQAKRWITASSEAKTAIEPKTGSATAKWKTRRKPASKVPKNGFCIRCKAVLPANPEKPYCKDCYKTSGRSQIYQKKGNHCHICGKKHPATLNKPLCVACYKEYKDSFKFVVS